MTDLSTENNSSSWYNLRRAKRKSGNAYLKLISAHETLSDFSPVKRDLQYFQEQPYETDHPETNSPGIQLPAWLLQNLSKLCEFENLSPDGDRPKASLPSSETCSIVKDLLISIKDFDFIYPPFLGICFNGAINIEIESDRRALEVEISDSNDFNAIFLEVEKEAGEERMNEKVLPLLNEFQSKVAWVIQK